MGGFFTEANVTIWTEFSAVFFLILFIGITRWTYHPKQAEQFIRESKLPLED
jgi:cbb3-type cytochrome oxidase subunit 3